MNETIVREGQTEEQTNTKKGRRGGKQNPDTHITDATPPVNEDAALAAAMKAQEEKTKADAKATKDAELQARFPEGVMARYSRNDDKVIILRQKARVVRNGEIVEVETPLRIAGTYGYVFSVTLEFPRREHDKWLGNMTLNFGLIEMKFIVVRSNRDGQRLFVSTDRKLNQAGVRFDKKLGEFVTKMAEILFPEEAE